MLTKANKTSFKRGHGLIDITGQKFGRLTAIKYVDYTDNNGSKWLFRCECGNDIITNSSAVRKGRTKSCGCLNQELRKSRAKHGQIGKPMYTAWVHMRQRCNNPKCKEYRNYGARGIKVCEEWSEFINFYNWSMENGYEEGLTIDRINNEGDYTPDNCRWVTMLVQENNKRNNHYIIYDGERMTLSQCAKKANVSRNSLYYWTCVKSMTAEEAIENIKERQLSISV